LAVMIPGSVEDLYIGCYRDNVGARAMAAFVKVSDTLITPQYCVDLCKSMVSLSHNASQ
jgi:hypothetical protein